MNTRILTATIKFIKDSQKLIFLLFTNVKAIVIPSAIPLLIFIQEVRCITSKICALISYIFNLTIYNRTVRYRFCAVLFYIIYQHY